MEPETPTKIGWLLSAPHGKFRKKSWQRRFYALYKASSTGIARLEMFSKSDGFRNKPATKIFSLENCIKVLADPQDNLYTVFTITTKTHNYTLAAQSPKEFKEWLEAVRNVAFGEKATPITKEPSPVIDTCEPSQTEENLIYSSLDPPNIFQVYIQESGLSLQCNLSTEKSYILKLVEDRLDLLEKDDELYHWPLHHIRRFGHTPRGFSLEAGRRCDSGEGKLHFITTRGKELFEEVDRRVKDIHLNEEKDVGVRKGRKHITHSKQSEDKPNCDSPPLKCSVSSSSELLSSTGSLPNASSTVESQCTPSEIVSEVEESIGLTSNKKAPITKPPRHSLMKHRSSLDNAYIRPSIGRRKVSSECREGVPPQPPLRSSASPCAFRNNSRNSRITAPVKRETSPYDIPKSQKIIWDKMPASEGADTQATDGTASDQNDGYEEVVDFSGPVIHKTNTLPTMKKAISPHRSSISSLSSNSPKSEVPHVTKGEHIYALVNKTKAPEKTNN